MSRFMDHTGQVLCLALLILLVAGCAPIRLPAIDPTGNRIFSRGNSTVLLTPNLVRNQAQSQPQPNPFGPASSPFPAPQTASTGPVLPAFRQPGPVKPCLSSDQCGFRTKTAKYIIPDPNGYKSAGKLGQIIMTPHRIIAPVGSEVVVIGGICGGDEGRFLLNQPLEWMLSNDSVGQFIEVGGNQHPTFNRIVPPTSRKIDGDYALGRTGLKEALLSRGTPTPADDIQLLKGQTYVSVSSESPGTSYITGVARKAEAWDKRRASTIIHWVDGVWSIPVPTTATAGTVHPLTTVISKSTTGGGLAGWKVRYSIVGGAPAEFTTGGTPADFRTGGATSAETTSDDNGNATVQIRQLAGQFDPGTTQVRVDVIRPEVYGQPELPVESGITTVRWSAPALTIKAIGPKEAGVDEAFNYRVQVTNPGDQIARDVIVRTNNFDDDLMFVSSTPKPTQYGREFEWKLGDIAPGSPAKTIDIQVKGKGRGNVGVFFEVLSQADGLKTEAFAQTEISVPCLGLKIEGPETAKQGQEVDYEFVILNQCQETLKNIRLKLTFGSGLAARDAEGRALGNPIQQVIEDIPFNETRTVRLKVLVNQPGVQCFDLQVTADGGHTANARECLDVVQADQANVEMTLTELSNQGVGADAVVEVAIKNNGTLPINGLTLTNRFSSSLTESQITETYRDKVTKLGDKELAVLIGRLGPGETEVIQIGYEGNGVDRQANTTFTVTNPTGEVSVVKGLDIAVGPRQPDRQPGNGDVGIPGDQGNNADRAMLDVALDVSPNAMPVNSKVRYTFEVTNRREQSDRNVRIEMIVPGDLRVDAFSGIGNNLNLNDMGNGLYAVDVIRELRPRETIRMQVEMTTLRPGSPVVEVQASSELSPVGNSDRRSVTIQ